MDPNPYRPPTEKVATKDLPTGEVFWAALSVLMAAVFPALVVLRLYGILNSFTNYPRQITYAIAAAFFVCPILAIIAATRAGSFKSSTIVTIALASGIVELGAIALSLIALLTSSS